MNRKVGGLMSHRERLQNIADQNGGIFRTSDLTELGYDSNGIRKLVADQVIERIKPSYFRLYGEDTELSEAAQVAQLFPDGVLCMYSALFYYRYSDRTPLEMEYCCGSGYLQVPVSPGLSVCSAILIWIE